MPNAPPVSAPLIFTISSMPRSQYASPSPARSRYPLPRSGETTVISFSLPWDWYSSGLSNHKQFETELSQTEQTMSSPSPERLGTWRLYFEAAMALIDVLGTEMESDAGIPMRWYDVLIHLEDTPDGLRMKDLAEGILYSKSGFTNVVDRMEKEGLVARVRPENDRRSILVVLTDTGRAKMEEARRGHRQALDEHFSSHLADSDIKALTRALEKLSDHARPLRPGRIRD